MGMLTPKEIDEFAPLLKPLEEQEPVLSAWRYHLRKETKKENKLKRDFKDFVKSFVYGNRRVSVPEKGQIVFLMTSYAPSASGSLIPILKILEASKIKPYIVVGSKTKKIEFRNMIMSEINEIIFTSFNKKFINNLKKLSFDMASEIERNMNNAFNVDYYWIFQGLAAREFSKKHKEDIKFVLSDSDKESFRKGFFLGVDEGAVLQHGFFNQQLFPIHAKYHFDWGPYFSKKAEEYGHPLNRSVSLGCPRFDIIEELKKKPKDKKFLEEHNLKSRPVVLAISGVHAYDLFPRSVELFYESLKSLIDNDISVIIRRHPAETDRSIYEKFLGEKRLRKCCLIEANKDLYEMIRNCDVVYQYASAVSIEAMLFGIPVLWEKDADGNPFKDIPVLGGGVYVESSNIVETVKEIGNESREKEKLIDKQYNFLQQAVVNKGKSTKKICEFILR